MRGYEEIEGRNYEEESTRARRRVGEAKYCKIQEPGPGLPFVSRAGIETGYCHVMAPVSRKEYI